MSKWIQEAEEEMERKARRASSARPERRRLPSQKKHGGKAKRRAIFAENMKKIAAKHRNKKVARKRA